MSQQKPDEYPEHQQRETDGESCEDRASNAISRDCRLNHTALPKAIAPPALQTGSFTEPVGADRSPAFQNGSFTEPVGGLRRIWTAALGAGRVSKTLPIRVGIEMPSVKALPQG
jgi:hypothetical protein